MLHIIKIDCKAIPSCAGRDDVVSIRIAQNSVTLTLETVFPVTVKQNLHAPTYFLYVEHCRPSIMHNGSRLSQGQTANRDVIPIQ